MCGREAVDVLDVEVPSRAHEDLNEPHVVAGGDIVKRGVPCIHIRIVSYNKVYKVRKKEKEKRKYYGVL
jgi:hypothetical protein